MRCQLVAVSEYGYTAQSDDELSFYAGQVLFLIDQEDDGWSKALLIYPGEDGWEQIEGLVPSTYISQDHQPLKNVVALYDYQKQSEEEIDIFEGDLLAVHDDRDEHWWLATKEAGSMVEVGLIPANYVEENRATRENHNSFQDPLDGQPQPQYNAAVAAPDGLVTYAASFQDKKNKRRNHKCLVGTDHAEYLYMLNIDDRTIIHRYTLEDLKISLKRDKRGLDVKNQIEDLHFTLEVENNEDFDSLAVALRATARGEERDRKGPLKGILGKGKKTANTRSAVGNSSVGLKGTTQTRTMKSGTYQMAPPLLEKSPAATGKSKAVTCLPPVAPPRLAIALYDFTPENEDEVEIREGDNLVVLEDESGADWLQVRVVSSRGRKEGLVPANYIEMRQTANPIDTQGIQDNSSDEARCRGEDEESREEREQLEDEPVPPPLSRRPILMGVHTGDSPPTAPTRPQLSQDDLEAKLARITAASRSDGDELPPPLPKGREAAEKRLSHRFEEESPDASAEQLARQQSPVSRRPVFETKTDSRPTPAASEASSPPSLNTRPQSRTISSRENAPAPKEDASTCPSACRVWQDRTGTFKVDAEFLGYQDNKVHLHKSNGVKIAVAIEKLSQSDIDHVFEVLGEPKPRHLQGSPARGSSLNAGDPSVPTSPIKVQVALPASLSSGLGQAPSVTKAVPGRFPQPECVFNDFDWYKFLTGANIPHSDAIVYGKLLVREKMDSTILADLSRDLLKDLGIPEGDIIRIMRSANASRPGGSSRIQEHEKRLEKQNLSVIGSIAATKSQKEQEKLDEEFARRLQIEERHKAARKVSESHSFKPSAVLSEPKLPPLSAPSSTSSNSKSFQADFSQLPKPKPKPVSLGLPAPLIPTPGNSVQTQVSSVPGLSIASISGLSRPGAMMVAAPATVLNVTPVGATPGFSSGPHPVTLNHNTPVVGTAAETPFLQNNTFSTQSLGMSSGRASQLDHLPPPQSTSPSSSLTGSGGPSGVFAGGGHPGIQPPFAHFQPGNYGARPTAGIVPGGNAAGGARGLTEQPLAPNWTNNLGPVSEQGGVALAGTPQYAGHGISGGGLTVTDYGGDRYGALKQVNPSAPSLFNQVPASQSSSTGGRPLWRPPTPQSLLQQQQQQPRFNPNQPTFGHY